MAKKGKKTDSKFSNEVLKIISEEEISEKRRRKVFIGYLLVEGERKSPLCLFTQEYYCKKDSKEWKVGNTQRMPISTIQDAMKVVGIPGFKKLTSKVMVKCNRNN